MNHNSQQSHADQSQSGSQNYRPRSPDLTDFSAPPPPRLSRLPSIPYQFDPNFPAGYHISPRGSYDASPYFSPSTSQPPSYFINQPHHPSYPSSQQSAYHSQPPFSQPHSQPHPSDDMARLRSRPQVNYNENAHREDEFDDRIMSQQIAPPPASGQPLAPTMSMPQAYPAQTQVPPVQSSSSISHIDVKTKFPVARIKRIMQADEDIGKVAQATPTAVAKALECFMIALVTKGAADAKASNSKRVTATHLKNALMSDPQYDFLKDICENTPDESAKKTKREKSEVDDGSASDDEEAGGKKRKGSKRRRMRATRSWYEGAESEPGEVTGLTSLEIKLERTESSQREVIDSTSLGIELEQTPEHKVELLDEGLGWDGFIDFAQSSLSFAWTELVRCLFQPSSLHSMSPTVPARSCSTTKSGSVSETSQPVQIAVPATFIGPFAANLGTTIPLHKLNLLESARQDQRQVAALQSLRFPPTCDQ